MKHGFLVVMGLLMLMMGAVVAAQDEAPPAESGVVITWPMPVTEVWGNVPVIGTVNVPDLAIYFVEAIPLNDDLSIPGNAPWIPVAPASSIAVNDGVLAQIDTADAPDGLYALRLNVTTATGEQYQYVVSPLRLSNERAQAERERLIAELGVTTPAPEQPTAEPTAAAPEDTTPRVTPSAGNASVNVRRCDQVNNDTCPVLGFLNRGEVAPALARSANGTGWLQIRLPSGLVGWVSPTVVDVLGNVSSLPLVAPPAPLPPPPTAIPASPIVLNGLAIEGGTLTCGVPGIVRVNVHNPGNTQSNAGAVTVQAVHLRTGSVTGTNSANFPAIAPGGNFVVLVPLTITTFFNEDQQLRASSAGQQLTLNFVLQQGNCGVQPTPPPQPTTPPSSKTFQRGECRLDILPNATLFVSPMGPVYGQVGPEGTSRDARAVALVAGDIWYELFPDRDSGPWVRASEVRIGQQACLL
jgi:hypothetical protein